MNRRTEAKHIHGSEELTFMWFILLFSSRIACILGASNNSNKDSWINCL